MRAKASTVVSASSGFRWGRTALTELLIPATAAGGAAAIACARSRRWPSNFGAETTISTRPSWSASGPATACPPTSKLSAAAQGIAVKAGDHRDGELRYAVEGRSHPVGH